MLTIQGLSDFLKGVQSKLNSSIRANQSHKEKILIQTVKIAEETGELSNEILKHFKHQRTDKTDTGNLSHELADVILATVLLSLDLEIDLEKALEEKISVIQNRH